MSVRDNIRAKTVGANSEFRKKTIKYEGIEVELRQPSVGSRKALMHKASIEGKLDTAEFLVWGVIYNTYVPETNELVFEESDYDVLIEKPTGGFMDQFAEVIAELMNVNSEVEKKAKN
jgi:hypothetical protein